MNYRRAWEELNYAVSVFYNILASFVEACTMHSPPPRHLWWLHRHLRQSPVLTPRLWSPGVSLLSLGYALGLEIHRYGDDPQCMMGWETDVKLIFFAPMTLFVLLGLISTFLILCNMSTPQLRKQIMAIDHESMCYGYVYFAPYFAVTWIAGVLAYLRLEALENWPSFYPLFQVGWGQRIRIRCCLLKLIAISCYNSWNSRVDAARC